MNIRTNQVHGQRADFSCHPNLFASLMSAFHCQASSVLHLSFVSPCEENRASVQKVKNHLNVSLFRTSGITSTISICTEKIVTLIACIYMNYKYDLTLKKVDLLRMGSF